MKMDITKAFDKLKWNFLFILIFSKFSDSWIGMIKELICNTKGSLLVNRSRVDSLVLPVAFIKEIHYLLISSSVPKRSSS